MLVATRAHSLARTTSPASMASLVLRVQVLTRDRQEALRTRFRSLVLMRFRAPSLFAIDNGSTVRRTAATVLCDGNTTKAELTNSDNRSAVNLIIISFETCS